jgi:hypothetical protein
MYVGLAKDARSCADLRCRTEHGAIYTLPACPACQCVVDVDFVPDVGTCACGVKLRYRDAMTGSRLPKAEAL